MGSSNGQTWDADPQGRRRKEYRYIDGIRRQLRQGEWLGKSHAWPDIVEREPSLFFRAASAVLFDHDPLKVKFALEIGFEEVHIWDEYHLEAAVLVLLMDRWTSVRVVERHVREVLGWFFGGLDEPDGYYTLIGRDLWNALRAHRGLPQHEFPDDIHLPPRQQPIAIFIDPEGETSDVPPQGIG